MYNNADALLDVARVFLNTAPEDRSGEDRTLVVVHVSAENIAGNVPAGTSHPAAAVCHIDGLGSVEPATAQRLACDHPVLGALVDQHVEVLALGRTRRLVSKRPVMWPRMETYGLVMAPSNRFIAFSSVICRLL